MDYSRGRLANKTWKNYKGVEMHFGIPDKGIGGHLIKINSNPLIVTTSSHSGMPNPRVLNHQSGNPYVWVKFKTSSAKRYYLDKLRKAGFIVQYVMDSEGDGGSYNIYMGERTLSQPEVASFWSKVTEILSSSMPVKKPSTSPLASSNNPVWW